MMAYLFSLRGRVNRLTYNVHLALGLSALVGVVIICLANLIGVSHQLVPLAMLVATMALLLTVWSQLAIVVKRLHDLGRPGEHCFLLFLPLYNLYLGIVLSCKPGTIGPNQFGADPTQTGLSELETVLNAACRHQSRGDWHLALELYQRASRLAQTAEDREYVDRCIADLQLRIAQGRAASAEVPVRANNWRIAGRILGCFVFGFLLFSGRDSVSAVLAACFWWGALEGIGWLVDQRRPSRQRALGTRSDDFTALRMSETDDGLAESHEMTPTAPESTPSVPELTTTPELPAVACAGLDLAGVALVAPVVAGAALFFVTSFTVSLAIGVATVLVTSILLSVDASRLGRTDSTGRDAGGPVGLFIGMCLLWIVGFPVAFYRRSRFAKPNLTIPAVAVALFFTGGPFLYGLFVSPDPPTCTSAEVVQVLDRIVRQSSRGQAVKSVDGFRELSFDREGHERHGQCVVHTDAGDTEVNYIVRWLDRDKRRFEVRIRPELPSCTSPEVTQLLNQIIRKTSIGPSVKSIDGFGEVRSDPNANNRQGRCIVHTDQGDIDFQYEVHWSQKDEGRFEVIAQPLNPTPAPQTPTRPPVPT
jgi:uncharacterized membrane protein YhaH (DUF805 family)